MAKTKGYKRATKEIYELQAGICSALAHPVRLEILDILGESEKNASELLDTLEIPKANLSQHLSVLKEAGVVQARKEGLYQYYSLGLPGIKEACGMLRVLLMTRVTQEEKQNSEIVKALKSTKV